MLTKNIDEMKVEVASHIAADQVVQGMYWGNNKGCFIGCLTHSDKAQGVTEKFGMPLPVVTITESVFEYLPEKEAVQFFADIPQAIGADGKDLSLVHWKFLRDTLLRLPEITPEIQTVIDGISLLAEGGEWSKGEAEAAEAAAEVAAADAAADAAAEAAARAAARAADAAVWSAGWSAYEAARAAREAARAAKAAARAARAAEAAEAARAAGWSAYEAAEAARAAERRKQAQSIIQLLKDAPVKAAH